MLLRLPVELGLERSTVDVDRGNRRSPRPLKDVCVGMIRQDTDHPCIKFAVADRIEDRLEIAAFAGTENADAQG